MARSLKISTTIDISAASVEDAWKTMERSCQLVQSFASTYVCFSHAGEVMLPHFDVARRSTSVCCFVCLPVSHGNL